MGTARRCSQARVRGRFAGMGLFGLTCIDDDVSSKKDHGACGSALAQKIDVTLEAMEKDFAQGIIVVQRTS